MDNRPTNTSILPTKSGTDLARINDIGFRLVLIPFFGIVIPLITGMTDGIPLSHWQTKASFGFTILIAFLIWEGNRYLLFTLQTYFNWFNQPVQKLIAIIISVSLYTVPVSGLLLTGWYYLFNHGVIKVPVIALATSIILICVLFITHVYETVFLVKDSQSEILKNEKLNRAKIQAELEALKNQIDPHFIFNSLNTLSHLIEENPFLAKQFNDNMADIYRYILQNKSGDLVMLREEAAFVKKYFALLSIRFGRGIVLTFDVPESALENHLILPVSLQLLIENAIKHNEFSPSFPLKISISITDETLSVINNIRKKNIQQSRAGIGLQNLDERYRIITGMHIRVLAGENQFCVILPILKSN